MPMGEPMPRRLERRLVARPGRPVAFLAFDLLHLDGPSLLGQPLVRRREALRRILRPGDEVVAVPAIATEGRALFEAIVAQGLAGMMARQRQGPYLPGTRSRLWRFIPAVAGAVPAAELADAPEEGPTSATAPVLAMLSRLPLDLDGVTAPDGRSARATGGGDERPDPGALAVQQHAGGVHPRGGHRHDGDGRHEQADRQRDLPRLDVPTISRASITNGLNGGTNDSDRVRPTRSRHRRGP